MSTLPPPATKPFPEDSLEKKVYNIANSLSEFLPIMNDRNRLGYNLFKFMTGEGDDPTIIIKHGKYKIEGITKEELAANIKSKLENL